MANKIYVGDIGTQIVLDTGEDLSGATAVSIEVLKPDGTTDSWSATVSGNTIVYETVDGDLDMAGTWKIQGLLTISAWTGKTETVSMKVYAAFK